MKSKARIANYKLLNFLSSVTTISVCVSEYHSVQFVKKQNYEHLTV